MKIVAIEANIAAGKTTLLKPLVNILSKRSGYIWKAIEEPVDKDPLFLELLQAFVDNPLDADARIMFQLYITHSRQGLLKNLPDGNYVIERSLYSDIIFCHASFLMTEQPSAKYMTYFYRIKEYMRSYPKIDLVVYLDRNVNSCFSDCMKRARQAELNYTIEYFKDLKAFHDACLPQIVRQYGSRLLTHKIKSGYACPLTLAKSIIKNFKRPQLSPGL
ncbi:deoxynucleoside kinase [Yokenella regensburgei]|uniref:deoxynucleoside kinase n=1 Tax=Yokenella regensburgei TaxID=158877 RepID=UPI0035AF2BAA